MEYILLFFSIIGIAILFGLAWYADKKKEQSFEEWGEMSEKRKAEFFKEKPFKIIKKGE